MRASMFIAVALLSATHPLTSLADTDYSAVVKQPYVRNAAVKRVAVMPVTCPENIDCKGLVERLEKSLRNAGGLEPVSPSEVSSVMRNAQITTINYETRYILAEGLTVDAFAVLEVRQAAVEKGETTYVKMGVAKVPQEGATIKHVQLALQMVAKDGKALLDATGEAHLTNSLRGLSGIAERVCERMVEEAIPRKD